MTTLLIIIGSALGTFIGNGLLLWLVGAKAKKLQQEQAKEIEAFQKGLQDAIVAEQSRMAKYAKMES